jgi:hypothetical protein
MGNSADLKWIQSEIKNLDDPELIALIKKLLLYRSKTSQRELNTALDEAFEDLAKGKTTPHEEVRKKYEKWL